MSTTKTRLSKKRQAQKKAETPAAKAATGEQILVALSDIDISPLNYRKWYDPQALEAFATELGQHGIIQNLVVRRVPSGRYELVVGERRYRAATIVGLAEVPVVVRDLSDDDVREIQLAENLQREDPHPLHEAQAIGQMQAAGKTTEEIAARLGKSKAFVYSRIKLLSLIDSFQEMFLAGVLTISEGVEIAQLTELSQRELYEQYCNDWQEREQWSFSNLRHMLSRFRYNLKRAPFDPADSNLLPGVGACTGCPFNSATVASLFPEMEEKAVCTNRECYGRKCTAQGERELVDAFKKEWPEALLFDGEPSPDMVDLLAGIPGALDLPHHNFYDVHTYAAPAAPEREDFELDEDAESSFDEEGYQQAVADYETELEEFNTQRQNGSVQKGLLMTSHDIRHIWFTLSRRWQPATKPTVTIKAVEEAMKAKTVTPEMLGSAIERIQKGEERAKELDRAKVQLRLHQAFSVQLADVSAVQAVSSDDLAARLLIYQSLDYSHRSEVDEVLFRNESVAGAEEEPDFLTQLADLTSTQFSYMVRVALSSKPEGKLPGNVTARCVALVAQEAGIDLEGLQREQGEKAEARWKGKERRIQQLEKLQKRLLNKPTNVSTPENVPA